jgi:hypothetical protein
LLFYLGNHEALGQIPPVYGYGYGNSVTVQFASNSYTVNESDGTAVLTVTLSAAAANVVTVNYATSDGTAVAGTDYTTASGTVTFDSGATSQTVSVGIIDNGNYSDQSIYFTVALNNASSNATLAAPSSTTVNVLDDDLAPTAEIEITGVDPTKKLNPGGYVQVNANNDNGSQLLYADLKTVVPAGGYGIPKMRDFDPANVKLVKPDPDLVQIPLTTNNLKAGGPENIVLSVAIVGRAKVQTWNTWTKNTQVNTPTNWTLATMLPQVYVEGLLESDALQQVTLQLQILNKGKVVATDKCVLTVTPVLQDLMVKVAVIPVGMPNAGQNAFPDQFLDPNFGLEVSSGASELAPGVQPIAENATAQWNAVRGGLRFIQTASQVNNLAGATGASLGPRTWDFAVPKQTLVDCLANANGGPNPFYTANEAGPNVNGGVATNSITDAPFLPLTAGPIVPATGQNLFLNSVLPGAGQKTNIDVTYNFVTYATVAFQDNPAGGGSIWCLGQQSWNVHYAGQVTPANGGGFNYAAAAGNANNGSGVFGPAVRNNANPTAIGPTMTLTGGAGWR